MSLFNEFIFPFLICLIVAGILFPLMIRFSSILGLVDVPNARKVHKQPIPAIGGLVIVLSVFISCFLSDALLSVIKEHMSFAIVLLLISITGVLDDRLNLNSVLRFIIQITCASVIAYNGIRLQNLYGILGVHELNIYVQYILTIFIIVGITNAFNLIDGIDGLAGSVVLINIVILCVLSFLLKDYSWLPFLLAMVAALIIFLQFNWQPAKVFMGDGGSLTFGILISSLGIYFVQSAGQTAHQHLSLIIVLVTGFTIIPVIDTLRVFYNRIKSGRSPFSADKNHLHHWLIKHHIIHADACKKIVTLHLTIIVFSAFLANLLPISWIVIIQVVLVMLYTRVLQLISSFYGWVRVIRKMESVNS